MAEGTALICLAATGASSDFDRDNADKNVEEPAYRVSDTSKKAEGAATASLSRNASGWVVGHPPTLTTVAAGLHRVDISSDL